MKVYRIFFYAYIIVALYNFIYVKFFQETTYRCYTREYCQKHGNVYPTYKIGEYTNNEPDFYERCGVPPIGKYLRELYLKTYLDVILLFIPLLIFGIAIFFAKKKYKDKKWWISQLIAFTFLFYIVVVLSKNM